MFYSEKLQSPISSYNVKRLYGVNPDNEPARAALIGILPLEEAPVGYTASYYVKTAAGYRAIPHSVSNTDFEMLSLLRQAGVDTVRTVLGIPEEEEVQP